MGEAAGTSASEVKTNNGSELVIAGGVPRSTDVVISAPTSDVAAVGTTVGLTAEAPLSILLGLVFGRVTGSGRVVYAVS